MNRIKTIFVIMTLCLISTFLLAPIQPTHALENPVFPVCDPWKYQQSTYEYQLGITYLVDMYSRNCNGLIETMKKYQVYLPENYKDYVLRQMMYAWSPILFHKISHAVDIVFFAATGICINKPLYMKVHEFLQNLRF